MRKADTPVKEVVCSETGKPMPKIPMWMADINVKFVSDEARQRHSPAPILPDLEKARGFAETEELKELEAVGALLGDEEEEEVEEEADDADDLDA